MLLKAHRCLERQSAICNSNKVYKSNYQCFAKQNYTMLDNLKLGYGGTKSEMERVLADAEKISGIKDDLQE